MSTKPPQVGIGAIVFHRNKVLLVKRKQDPSAGQWAIPGGRIEWGETLQQAAEREVLEETGIRIKAGEPVFAFDLLQFDSAEDCRLHYVVIDLAAEYLSGEPRAGSDAAAARWVGAAELAELPVNEMTRRLLQSRFRFG